MTTDVYSPINIKGVVARLGLEDALIRELVQMYLGDAAIRLREMEDLLAAAQTSHLDKDRMFKLQLCAHSIKGGAANLGLEGVEAIASQLEGLALAHDFGAMPAYLIATRRELEIVERYLSRLPERAIQ